MRHTPPARLLEKLLHCTDAVMGDYLSKVELGLEPVVQQVIHLLGRRAMRVSPATQVEAGHPLTNERAQLACVWHAARGSHRMVTPQHGQGPEAVRSGP